MMDYSIFYKTTLPTKGKWDEEWDVFISAFNDSERVKEIFKKASAKNKYWLIFPDYNFDADGKAYPKLNKDEKLFALPPQTETLDMDNDIPPNEAEYVLAFIEKFNFDLSSKICIDITGFIKPYMMYLLRFLVSKGVKKIDVIFTEPKHYGKKEKTTFSDEKVIQVRQVAGFEGIHDTDTSNDILVIGAGYDHKLMMHLSENKDNTAKKIRIFGFPSLRPEMYQQNILRSNLADNSIGSISTPREPDNYFAPANDPFVTASLLSEVFENENRKKTITNFYISPVATKPQALGFTIFYITECLKKPVSMLYPFCATHSKQTSEGVFRIWKYTIEFQ